MLQVPSQPATESPQHVADYLVSSLAPLGVVAIPPELFGHLLPLFLRDQPHYSAIGHVDSGWFMGLDGR